MKKNVIIFAISILVHIALFIFFMMIKSQLDVFTLIIFMVSPIFINVLLSFIGSKLQEKESKKVVPIIITYVGVNLIYWILLNIQLNMGKTLELIYETSRQYNSDMIEISADNSPIGALIMLLLVSFVLYYFSIRVASRSRE